MLRPQASCSRAQHHCCASRLAPGLGVTTLGQARHQRRTSDGAPLPPGGVSMIDSNRVNTQTRRWRRSSRRVQSTAVCVVCQRVRRASRGSARLPAAIPTEVAHAARAHNRCAARASPLVCGVDCGVPENPDVIRAQMEGGIGFALSALYYGEIEIKAGRAVQRNFDRYKAFCINEMPKVEVHIVASNHAPTGVGEPGVPPLAPAVANALARLGIPRARRLPLVRARLVAG